MPNLLSLATCCVCLELRSLPSPGITRLHRYYEPLRHPKPPGLSLTGVRFVIPDHVMGLPVLRALSLMYMLPPLPRCSSRASSLLISSQPYQPSPIHQSGRPARRPFRGLLGVHSRCGLHTRAGHQFVTRYPKASAISLPCMGLFLSRAQIWLHCFSFFAARVVGICPAAGARNFVTIKGGTRHRARRLAAIQPCIR